MIYHLIYLGIEVDFLNKIKQNLLRNSSIACIYGKSKREKEAV